MGIYDKIINNTSSIKYYGINDLSTYIHLKEYIEK